MRGKEPKLEHGREILASASKGRAKAALVEHLVEGGASRLAAERIAAIEHGEAEPGRARRHSHARH